MTERGLLIVISGPSGVGKDTILDRFMLDAECCVRSISATTRKPREGERDGEDYFFVTHDAFERLIAQGDLLEYTDYNGNYYGTPRKNVEKLIGEGKNVILKIEVHGGLQVKKLYPEAVLVFIVAPDREILEQRLRSRATENEDAIQGRLKTADFELSKAEEYDYIIINDVLEHCSKRLAAVITAAGCERRHMEKFIREVCRNA